MEMTALLTTMGLPTPNQGGPSRVALELLKIPQYLVNKRLQVLALFGSSLTADYIEAHRLSIKDDYGKNLESAAMRIKKRIVRSFPNLLFFPNFKMERDAAKNLYMAVNRCKPSIIHAHDAIMAYQAVQHFADIPIVFTSHHKGSGVTESLIANNPYLRGTLFEKFRRKQEREAFRRATVVTFPSLGAKALLEKEYHGILDGRDVRIVYNGIEKNDFTSINIDDKMVTKYGLHGKNLMMCVANYIPEKGHIDLLDALVKLNDNDLGSLRVLLTGTGYYEDSIRERIHLNGLESVVTITGVLPHEQIIGLLHLAVAFVMPSIVSVFDLALLEAMATNTAIVTTGVGGNLEMLDQTCAFLVPPNDPTCLAYEIENLLNDPDRRRQIVANARDRVEKRFSFEAMSKDYVSIYEEIIAKSGSRVSL